MKLNHILAAAAAVILCSCHSTDALRSSEDFNFDWRFSLGDAQEWSAENFDDSQWRELHLPHDWSIEGNFSKDNPSTPGGGALPGGIGWYRKHFSTPELSDGKRVWVEFDGVFMNSTVYVNGQEMGTRPYGYSSFRYDITSALHPEAGADNLIAVRCDNALQPNSRWYAGCGIYRDVRLTVVPAVHVAWNGTFVRTPSNGEVAVTVEVENGTQEPCEAEIAQRVLDANGRAVAGSSRTVSLSAGLNTVEDSVNLASYTCWDVTNPYLYTLETTVNIGGKAADRYLTRFGVRSCEWDKDRGFLLNGREMKLLGVCLHHDSGALGTAVHRRALQRQLQILKDMGVNAIRTSHNPPAPTLLELCDEMGFVVIDEGMDMWRKRKTAYDYARFFDEWHERDIRDFVQRDRNHPCVIMWSAGNEILEQWNSSEDDIKNLTAEQANLLMNFMSSLPQYESSDDNPNILLAKHLAAIFKDMDPTRPVTAGLNETAPSNNLIRSGALDILGFNYHTWDYDKVREWYPDSPMYGSETVSGLQSRGVYFQPSDVEMKVPAHWSQTYETPHHQCPAYDSWHAPWSDLHEWGWYTIKERPYMAGTFVWTGFDYLGEPTPYSWPSRSSYFGIVDLAGFPKDVYWMYQSEWTDKPVLHLFPHWNWNEGDVIDVWAYYGQADEVELFLNGKSLGRSSKEGSRLHAQWLRVPYEPGVIEAVSYKDGAEVMRDRRETTGEPVALKLTADRTVIDADGYDLSYVTVEAVDSEGRAVPTADLMLHFDVKGAGELAGVDNGNAADTLSLKGHDKALFSGKALGIVRSIRGQKGTASLTVTSEVGDATIDIKTK